MSEKTPLTEQEINDLLTHNENLKRIVTKQQAWICSTSNFYGGIRNYLAMCIQLIDEAKNDCDAMLPTVEENEAD